MCILSILGRINPEIAHRVAILALKYNLAGNKLSNYNDFLQVNKLDCTFSHPIGLAAGFDKNAECVQQLLNCGFSFVEVGTLTIKSQTGNPKPRIFRLKEDQALINRLGFNNKGLRHFQNQFKKRPNGIVGINLGINKDTNSPIGDYIELLENVYSLANYITVNISSPNTRGLRKLQQKSMLKDLLNAIKEKNLSIPIMLKIAPDITEQEKDDIALLALEYKLDGLILTNTTIKRIKDLKSHYKNETGGLSGSPLFSPSTQVLKDMYKLTNGEITLIGCGGIFNGYDAYTKIKAGASLLQIYTALIYKGLKVIDQINLELIKLLKKDGFKNIQEAIGIDVK